MPIHTDTEACLRAVRSRDARFDGWFYVAVTSTGIYCRPSCPAAPARPVNLRFHPSAASAQSAGFRACKRCRPDASPGSPEWNVREDLVARAMRLIADGVVDSHGVEGLAARLGYSSRQVERLVRAELGAGPLALARAQRAQTARTLIESTTLPMADVAFAAGFTSIRSFNDTVRAVFASTPSQLRARAGTARRGGVGTAQAVSLRLPYRRPLHVPSLFGHLAATAVPGVESWSDGMLHRSLSLPHGPGVVSLRPAEGHLEAVLRLSDLRDLTAAVHRCRRLLDLDADPVAADAALAADPVLAPLVRERPGCRLPGTVDPAEFAVRVVLGQQISTAAAATVAGRLVDSLGQPLPAELRVPAGPTHLFPEPRVLAALEPDDPGLPGMPAARRRTLTALTTALTSGALVLDPATRWDRARADLAAIPGLGPWSIEMIALRGLGDPDAFPASDLGVRGAAAAIGLPASARALGARAAAWRPWRSYAVQALWASSDHAAARLPHSIPSTRESA